MQMQTPSGAGPHSYTKALGSADASSLPGEAFLCPADAIEVPS